MKPLLLALALIGLLITPALPQSITVYQPDGSVATGQIAGNAFSTMDSSGNYTFGYRDSLGNITIQQFDGLDKGQQQAPRSFYADDDGGDGD